MDVYHEFSHPEQMLAAMREALKPDGLLALVEFRAEDAKVPIQPLHKMSKEQILKELPANGFRLVKQFDKLPWQHLMFFGRDEQWQPRPISRLSLRTADCGQALTITASTAAAACSRARWASGRCRACRSDRSRPA